MNIEHESELYTKIKQFMATFQYRSDIGLNFELMDMLPDIAHVKEYDYSIDENDHYQITLEIKDFNVQTAKEAFVDLLHFIEYCGATIYTRQISEDAIKYLLASLSPSDGIGFMMEIKFVPYRNT